MAPAVPENARPSATNGAQLWLVRHAQPLIAPGLCYGRLDVAAEPAATRACAQRLAQALPQRLHVAYSPLLRCELLAQYLQALRPDLTYEPEARLREFDFGQWEGRAWSDIGQAALERWVQDFAAHRPGGGESLAEMLARVAHALQQARERARTTGQPQLWIMHAGVARCVAWLQALGNAQNAVRLPQAHEWPRQAPQWGEWQRIDLL
ncbi:alpha-ribazole phosphatase [Extensimonas vulgaris]|uniref:Alpha-ribazole phosphatase n=1 Tax=Extensimonas vulgaris TaxID=1031594 RepID=A0A369AJF5_9BURK|nr:histidine phosphatase family protein [Extensimonas vulgaris]RCX09500.1 alpha-ribazole phosphatase [Extensimonas vulgaris]TWI38630.1 alpha-ribazole phosphatase [Extensimonas vulgaris]TXD14521.1 phosphoglycerate kinase [Extensimonas vulgaris]